MRKFLLALVLLVGVLYIFFRASEVGSILGTLQAGDWRFLILGFLAECFWIATVTLCYRSIFNILGIGEKFKRLMIASLGAYFVNVVAPSAGVSGVAVFMSEARQRQYSPARALVAGTLYVMFDYLTFLGVLILGLIVLFRRNHLTVVELSASGIFITLAILLGFFIYLGMHSNQTLGRFLSWAARSGNKLVAPFLHRELFSEQHALTFAHDTAEGIKQLNHQPKQVITTLVLFLTKQFVLVLILFISFLAFHVPASVGTLVAAYTMGTLSLIVSPTPAGLGIVEGTLALVLSSMHVPEAAALVITLAYRGFTFWFPLILGLIAFRILGARAPGEDVVER